MIDFGYKFGFFICVLIYKTKFFSCLLFVCRLRLSARFVLYSHELH